MAVSSSASSHFLAGKKIIVAGAGLGGLSFILALHKQWTSTSSSLGSPSPPIITVYERDKKLAGLSREGYSLSIRSDGLSGGMQALHKLGLLEAMLRVSIAGTKGDQGAFVIWDKNWKEILKMKAQTSDKDLLAPSLRIARKALREVLIDAIPPQVNMQWETTCTGVVQLSKGKVQVQLSNGEADECDLLIAADGANSKIRACLRPDDTLSFTGAVCIGGRAKFSDGIPAPVDKEWGTIIGASGTGVFASPLDEQSAVWSLSYLASEPRERVQGVGEELLQEALDRGRVIAQPFKTLVQATDVSNVGIYNAKDKAPFPHIEKKGTLKYGNVIFIGDSNHAMSPFAGNGANMALMDGWELANELCKSNSLLVAVTAYDLLSLPRSKRAIRTSHWSITIAHAQGWKLIFCLLILRSMKFLFF
jgi:2-polyprenyl-6-methoxyphenol hydroxylase-like FAD-dependent oxidoreductase